MASPSSPSPGKLAHLDGLRGLAALYVVLFHAVLGFDGKSSSFLGKLIDRTLSFGHEAVAVFIVLSGYCLTLSASGQGTRSLDTRFAPFMRRRAKRILPPYYVALLGSLVLIATVPALGGTEPTNTIWDESHPAFTRDSLLTHLLLIHNWFPETVHTINGPLWSVATEWQIYLLFPTVFLPVRQRFGWGAMVAIGFVLGYGSLLLWPTWSRTAVSWYIALFVIGIAGALVHVSDRPSERARLAQLPWKKVATGLTVTTAAFGLIGAKVWFSYQPWTDLLVGLSTGAVLIALAEARRRAPSTGLLRLLESRGALWLGHVSYSLYLSHLPVLALLAATLGRADVSPALQRAAMAIGGTALSLLVAVILYWLVERPSLRRGPEA